MRHAKPFLAILLAWIFVGEAVTLLQLLGGAIVVAGILVSRRYSARPAT